MVENSIFKIVLVQMDIPVMRFKNDGGLFSRNWNDSLTQSRSRSGSTLAGVSKRSSTGVSKLIIDRRVETARRVLGSGFALIFIYEIVF